MKSEVIYSYEGLFFNFLAGLFVAVILVYCVGTLQASVFGDESLVYWFTCFSGILNVHFTA
jgi:hypothetical protein